MPERKTLLLTGASRGIGHATVKRFSDDGWRVLTVSRDAFSQACPWADGPDNHLRIDLSDIAGLERSAGLIRERLPGGRLDALVNNAGLSPKRPGGGRLGLLDTDYRTWVGVFDVNLFSTALLAKLLFPELKAAGGSIVNVTSIAGSRVHPFAGPAYATSKAALAALTRPGRDRHRDALAGHRRARALADPDAPAGPARGGRRDDLVPVHRRLVVPQWRRGPHQRRTARLASGRTSPQLHSS
jgi:NAD(P)-dependent dehydrogenase (short-subunit alcohol dehydrogenase family)